MSRSTGLRSAVLLALLLAGVPGAAWAEAERPPALKIERGSVASRQVVALGRDLVIAGRVESDVAVLNGKVTIEGEVAGDVIVLGGGAEIGGAARVGGDVFVLGGSINAAPGAAIAGRSVAYPDASSAWLALLEAPTLGQSGASSIVLGAKLALLTAWLALVLLFFATSGRQVLATSETVVREPFRCFAVGLTGVVTMVLTAMFFSLFAAALVGVPLLVLVVLLGVVLKLWGMVAVFHAFGGWVVSLARSRRPSRFGMSPLNVATVGLLVLGAIKLLPWVGLLAWHVATFIGVGAALLTKLGRREPWFDFGLSERLAARL